MLLVSIVSSTLWLAADAQQRQHRKLGDAPDSGKLPALNIALGIVSAVVVVILLFLAAIIFIKQRFFTRNPAPAPLPGTRLSSSLLTSQPVEFSLKDIISATSNFSDRVGTGLLGSVFRGTLPGSNKTPVAVKKLSNFYGTDREFRSRISHLGSISHPAIAKLLGFCSEAKILVYEFLPNGSLDKLLFEGSGRLAWEFRIASAISIAGGIEHLHQQEMIHGNIKSENILLDSGFQPKVCDSGLGLLVDRNRLKAALSSGVNGYLSPEWDQCGDLTMKSDVFGFGVVLLEMIGGRRLMDLSRRSEEWNLVDWARKQVKLGKISEIVDPKLENDERVVRAIDVALACIHHDSDSRPSMSKVVEMLQSSI